MKKFLFSLLLLAVGMITANAFTANDVGRSLLRTEVNVHQDYAPIVPLFVFETLIVQPPLSSPVCNGYGFTAITFSDVEVVLPPLFRAPTFSVISTTYSKHNASASRYLFANSKVNLCRAALGC